MFKHGSYISPGPKQVPGNNSMGFKNKVEAHKEGKLSTGTKKISSQEIQYKRKKGLCFKCGEKYGFGHVCKLGNLNFILAEDEEEIEFDDAIGVQDESTGNPGQVMEPLCALSKTLERNTIVTQGLLSGSK